jgi:regulator of RNase E activity RraA
MPDRILDRLRALDSCAVSDALDALRLPGATTGIGPLWPVAEPVVGRVRTVLAGPRESDRPAQHIAAAAIEAAGPGEVIVIANGGRTDVSSWGGILTLAALGRGLGGVVIDGACRDIVESEEQGFPVFGRSARAAGSCSWGWASRSSSPASPCTRATWCSPTATAWSSSRPPKPTRW